MTDTDVDQLVLDIYKAAMGELPWPAGLQLAHQVLGHDRIGMHLQNATAIFWAHQRLMRPASVGLELLQRLPQPLLLLDETRRVVFCNEAAQQLLATSKVLALRAGLLCGPDAAADANLMLALRSLGLPGLPAVADEQPTERVFLCVQNGVGKRLGVYLYAMHPGLNPGATPGDMPQARMAMVMLHDPNHDKVFDPCSVAATWGLTPTEAKVAIALAQGHGMKEIAQVHGVSLNTVRTQVRVAMDKMGISRQADLVRQLAGLPPALA